MYLIKIYIICHNYNLKKTFTLIIMKSCSVIKKEAIHQ